MGNKQSISQELKMESVTENIFSSLTTNSQDISSTNNNINEMMVELKNISGCGVTLAQNIDAKTTSDGSQSQETITNMSTEVANEMAGNAKSAIESETGSMSTAFGDKAETSVKVEQLVKNIVKQEMVSENMQKIVASAANINDGVLTIDGMSCRPGEGIDFSQDITSQVTAQAVADALVEAVRKDASIGKFLAETEALNKKKSTGLLQDFGTAISGILGAATWIYAISGIVLCIICAALLAFMLSPAAQNATGVIAEAGAAKIGNPYGVPGM